MKNLSAHLLPCFFCFFMVVAAARSQSVPAQTGSPLYSGFQMPDLNGTLRFAVSAGERLTTGSYYGTGNGNFSATTLSGNLGLISPSITKPTTIDYSGGYLYNTSQVPSSFFHDFRITQGYNTRYWRVSASDNVRYLPETETTGISGVVGVGTTTGTIGSQGVVLPYASRVYNTANGDVTVDLTGKSSIDVIGLYSIDRFLGNTTGLQVNNYSVDGGLVRRIDAITSFSVRYVYNTFSYIGYTGTITSQGVSGMYQRQINRRFRVSLAAGPQYLGASSLTGRPATVSYTADLLASYVGSAAHGFTASASYKRATTGGSGVTFGALNDTFTANASYRLTRSLVTDGVVTYQRSNGLQFLTSTPIDSQSFIASLQANRAFTRQLSAFVSYSAQQQSIQGYSSTSLTPLNGLRQIFGFGVTYSPSPVHLGGR